MDAELAKKIYSRVPILIREENDKEMENNPWGIRFMRMMDMSNDSHLFEASDGGEHLPLYEAKMIHQFDHRWASYGLTSDGKDEADDVSVVDKQNPDFTVRPRYWVKKREVLSRLARVPRAVALAYAAENDKGLLVAFANWLEVTRGNDLLIESFHESRNALIALGGEQFASLSLDPKDWRDLKIKADALNYQPLNETELLVLKTSNDLLRAVDNIMDGRSPRWLLGFRGIARAHDERTLISSITMRIAAGNSLPILLCMESIHPMRIACLAANLNSIVTDFAARFKVGGINMNFFIVKQFPVLPPNRYTDAELSFIVPRVLSLIYTAHDLKAWAKDLGYSGEPFPFDPERRAQLRAELDAYFARLYDLTRDELRYILDPADIKGPDYPSETFRVLKTNEEKTFGEYRTRRLVLAAWDALEGGELH